MAASLVFQPISASIRSLQANGGRARFSWRALLWWPSLRHERGAAAARRSWCHAYACHINWGESGGKLAAAKQVKPAVGASHQYSGVSQSGTEGKMRAVVLLVSMMTCLHAIACAVRFTASQPQPACQHMAAGHSICPQNCPCCKQQRPTAEPGRQELRRCCSIEGFECQGNPAPVELRGVEAQGLVEAGPRMVVQVHGHVHRVAEEAAPRLRLFGAGLGLRMLQQHVCRLTLLPTPVAMCSPLQSCRCLASCAATACC